MVELWLDGQKLGDFAGEVDAIIAAHAHAEGLGYPQELGYDLRHAPVKYIIKRPITGPDAPALGPVLTISSTELTVTLDRPATGPTQIDHYELERYNGSAWVQIASGISIFAGAGYADTSLTASTTYQYRARAVDTTSRASEYSYSTGITGAGAVNQAPVWDTVPTLSVQAGSSVDVSSYASDPEGDQLVFSKVSSSSPATLTVSPDGVISVGSATTAGAQSVVVKADDGLASTNKTVNLTVSVPSTGNTFYVPTGSTTWSGTANGVQPGDTVIIRRGTGTRSALKLTALTGTSGNRITVKNETGGLLTISQATTFVLNFENCRYVDAVFDNSMTTETVEGKSVSYGLLVTVPTAGNSFTSLIKTSGTTSFLKISNFKLDGKWSTFTVGSSRVGIQTYDAIGRTKVVNGSTVEQWTESIELSDFVITSVSGEGIYGGGNFYNTAYACNRNMSFHDGIIQLTGREAIQGKSWLEGTNSMYNLVCKNIGKNAGGEPDQLAGLSIIDGQVDIYNCKILNSGGPGIQYFVENVVSGQSYASYGSYTSFVSDCYNNIISGAGAVSSSRNGHGISVGAAPTLPARIKPTVHVYSNTVVNSRDSGVDFNAQTNAASVAENNILLGNTAATSLSAGGTGSGNYSTGTVAATLDANYRPIAERAAAGTIGVDYSSTDIEGTSRAGTATRGAYEYS